MSILGRSRSRLISFLSDQLFQFLLTIKPLFTILISVASRRKQILDAAKTSIQGHCFLFFNRWPTTFEQDLAHRFDGVHILLVLGHCATRANLINNVRRNRERCRS